MSLHDWDALVKEYYVGNFVGVSQSGAFRKALSQEIDQFSGAAVGQWQVRSSATPRIHPRDARGWLLCEGCSEANEYAEAPADGPFICGECRAVRDG